MTKEQAEIFCGRRLDGRKKYFIWESRLCTKEKATVPCSGCSEDEYDGFGCSECGYSGKRVISWPNPVHLESLEPINN